MNKPNPAMSRGFSKVLSEPFIESMTVSSTINKTFMLLAIMIISAAYTWARFFASGGYQPDIIKFAIGGAIVGSLIGLITSFAPKLAKFTAPLYAIAEGFFIGGISAIIEMSYPGIVLQAVGLTFAIAFVMASLYRSGIIRATSKFKSIMLSLIFGVVLFSVINIVLSMFGIYFPAIYGNGPLGIAISLFIAGVAAFSLIIDFDFIYRASEHGAPKYMEWYGAFALMVGLVWLYLRILNLLSKLQRD